MIFIITLPNFHSPSLNVSPKTFVYPRPRGKQKKNPRKSCKNFPFNKMENINFYLPFEWVCAERTKTNANIALNSQTNIADGEL